MPSRYCPDTQAGVGEGVAGTRLCEPAGVRVGVPARERVADAAAISRCPATRWGGVFVGDCVAFADRVGVRVTAPDRVGVRVPAGDLEGVRVCAPDRVAVPVDLGDGVGVAGTHAPQVDGV